MMAKTVVIPAVREPGLQVQKEKPERSRDQKTERCQEMKNLVVSGIGRPE